MFLIDIIENDLLNEKQEREAEKQAKKERCVCKKIVSYGKRKGWHYSCCKEKRERG